MTHTMDYSHFAVLLGNPRSGTTALRRILVSHSDICCFDEVFRVDDRSSEDSFIRRPNFFHFLEYYANGDVARIFPDQHDKVFLDYLAYLRDFTAKPYIVMDVKCTTNHIFMLPFKHDGSPYLYSLIRANGLRVINIRRPNYLRCALSQF